MKNISSYNLILLVFSAILSGFIIYLTRLNFQLNITEVNFNIQIKNSKRLTKILDSLEAQFNVVDTVFIDARKLVPVKKERISVVPRSQKDDMKGSNKLPDTLNNNILIPDVAKYIPCSSTIPFVKKIEPYGVAEYKINGCVYSLNLGVSTLKINLDLKSNLICSATYDVYGEQSECNSIFISFYNKYVEHYIMDSSTIENKESFSGNRSVIYIQFDNEKKDAKYKLSFMGEFKDSRKLEGTLKWNNGSEMWVAIVIE